MHPIASIDIRKCKSIGKGHPWIYPKAIIAITGEVSRGSLVALHNTEGICFGLGVYNDYSLYRIRILSLNAKDSTFSLFDIVQQKLRQAFLLRQALQLPNKKTTAYRLCNSEGDFLSGLTIDYFAALLVVASSAYWIEANQALIKDCIYALFPGADIIWLSQTKVLKQDGWNVSSSVPSIQKKIIKEDGVFFEVQFGISQKTGLYLDQRQNHLRIASLAKDKTVLDLYCYTGGFALHAAKSGAKKITAVDSSETAIQQAKNNALLNKIDNIDFIVDDARNYLSKADEYDLIILDPPKLAPSKKHIEAAKNYYRFLHRVLFQSMQANALLLTCNCSAALANQVFLDLINQQAYAVGKTLQILGNFGPANCHPILPSFPEGNYLTALLLRII